jgi:glycosyltransferase involved in cell wall biosynthesis
MASREGARQVERLLPSSRAVKVVQFHHSDEVAWGGGIVAMLRLHAGLGRAGVDSTILCHVKTLDSPTTVELGRHRVIEGALRRLTSRLGLNDVHCVSSFRIKDHPAYRAADVVHLHGTHSGYLSYMALPGLTRAKPVALTLHDMWAFTGHCAYSYDCDRWRTGCGRCPHLDAGPPVRRDATRVEWALKRAVYARSNLTVITLSDWITRMASASLLARFPIHQIPNGVDTDVYRPLDPAECRRMLGVPEGRRVLMWMAARLDPRHPEGARKGADLLVDALQRLPDDVRAGSALLLCGKGGERVAAACGMPTVDLGFTSSDRLKAIAYSAADLFLFPTRADNMPLVLLESLACGTPVASFRVGGVPDIVRPGLTGALAEPEDASGLGKVIADLLADDARLARMRESCRRVAVEEYRLDLHVDRHIALYESMIASRRRSPAAA